MAPFSNLFFKRSALSTLLFVNLFALPLSAQVAPGDFVPSAKDALSEPGLDDINNQPSQSITWVCQRENSTIAVEVKEMGDWQQVINPDQSWQCAQMIPSIPDGSASFSCEPSEKEGLVTVFWLAGAEGKAQMKGWMNDFANNQNLVCTRATSNPFWE